MNIHITKPAIQWFKEEFNLNEKTEYIRFFARYGGCGSIQSGFSLGISHDTEIPSDIGVEEVVDGIHFYISEEDIWYFKGYDLKVKYSRKNDEIEFVYEGE
ncbi:HesB/YadR/YfhF family protein [Halalkalibacter krulwichiae]|uniref:Iron-sulfur cluster biosynthesis n=1 Tax=Halalkalibacter krulwichiae TaxID=199441 RepID=A0A1X9ME52_9BACI|nr:HesB/YadR/YfhF family protein [Halalkalibacter krulwichiae]ARK30810.1 Iron-sulfur cluster biosynthesis [Halalkalibacter krulwichiae]